MIVSSLEDVVYMTVMDAGVPNEECVAIHPKIDINLGVYGIMIGYVQEDGTTFPYRDQLFWFGEAIIEKNDWIFVYTGSGSPRISKATNGINNIYTCFWGRSKTVFANNRIVPILFSIDAVSVAKAPVDQPQLAAPKNAPPLGIAEE